jgi:chromosomal replication initiation ATPase DnaA
MNTKDQAIQLIDKVCQFYKIKHEQMTAMSKSNHFKICKNSDGQLVRLAEIRMALSYFLYMHCPLKLTQIAPLVGYKDHSTMSIYRKRIEFYIETEDSKFYPYYLKVIDLASDLGISMKLKRILSYTNIAFIDHCGKVHLEVSN